MECRKQSFYTNSIKERVDQAAVRGRRMFKLEEEILVPDRRFAALYGVNASGVKAFGALELTLRLRLLGPLNH